MEEERDEHHQREIIWIQNESHEEKSQDVEDERGAADGEENTKDAEDLCVSVADVLVLETLTVPQIQVEDEQVLTPPSASSLSIPTQGEPQSEVLTPPSASSPSSPTQGEPQSEVLTPPSASSPSSPTQGGSSEPCFYCLRSQDSYQPEDPKQQEDADASSVKMSYQTDPRPHFGVAWSSHSTCSPLWGSEGPCWGPRNHELTDQIHPCPHCHLGLSPDTLRWHEAKCLLFEGLGTTKK